MTARSWADQHEPTVGSWRQPTPHNQPPLRLTPRGRTALRLAVAALLALAFAIGFFIRTPLDRAVLERGATPDQPAHNARSERTP